MRVKLQVTHGPHAGKVFSFQGHETFVVGRSSRAHLRLPAKDLYFSRVHFLVEINPPFCRLLDMASRNGTKVNGKKVDVADLRHGDVIKAGHTVFQVSLAEDDAEAASMAAAAETPAGPLAGVRGSDDRMVPKRDRGDDVTVPPTLTFASPLPDLSPTWNSVPPSLAPLPLTTANAAPSPTIAFPRVPACCVCGAIRFEVPSARAHIIEPRLCADCVRRMHSYPQTVPGYCLLRELGRGGMGVVYLAARNSDAGLVAVKTIIPAIDASPGEVKKFLREANILRELVHPNVVRFLEVNAASGQLWFAMEYVAGTDAARLLKKHGPLEVPHAVGLVSQLLEALEYAHARGFVHRDIKPANLLVTRREGIETAVLTDFGLARVYQASQLSGLTMTGALGGTPLFMPPEQITDYRNTLPSADQYAAGMTLYSLLSNKCGFEMPEKLRDWVQMILEEEPVPILERRPELPEKLAAIVHRALQKDPKARFADVRAMRKALKGFLA